MSPKVNRVIIKKLERIPEVGSRAREVLKIILGSCEADIYYASGSHLAWEVTTGFRDCREYHIWIDDFYFWWQDEPPETEDKKPAINNINQDI